MYAKLLTANTCAKMTGGKKDEAIVGGENPLVYG